MTGRTLVVGNGKFAWTLARKISAAGIKVLLAGGGVDGNLEMDPIESAAGMEILTYAHLAGCRGTLGRFEVLLQHNQTRLTEPVNSIVIAEECRREDNLSLYGLKETPAVLPVSKIKNRFAEAPVELDGKTTVFLNGLAAENEPVMFAEMAGMALELVNLRGSRVYFMSPHLKVAGTNLEALYRQAKAAGVFFFKFSKNLPLIQQGSDGTVSIEFVDETAGHPFSLVPDITVVDETIRPSKNLEPLGRVLQLHTDTSGFLQTENVHRLPVFTNRKGILATGPSRAVMAPVDLARETANTVAALLTAHGEDAALPAGRAFIDSGSCIRCLTCFRLCPHRSIEKGARIEVVEKACEGCGICAAECPREAITLSCSNADGERLAAEFTGSGAPHDSPAITAFCCARSAARARDAAVELSLPLPGALKVIEVPCAGSISQRHVLEALNDGAGGVLVLTCHEGNCHSEVGNARARQRAQVLLELMQPMGLHPARLEIHTLASNMATEFANVAKNFSQTIEALDEASHE